MKTLPILLGLAFLAAACGDPVHPDQGGGAGLQGALVPANGVATNITYDGGEAASHIETGWPAGGTHVGKQFDASPHLGDAIVVTFTWRGSSNTITTVTDHLEDGTPVGNTYTLVDYVTSGGWSSATYIATNVRNFPDPAPSPDKVLAVHAIFSDVISDASEMLSSYRGVSPVTALAIGAHRAASGNGGSATMADPGPIAVDAGDAVYAFSWASSVVDDASPAGMRIITQAWDAGFTSGKEEGDYLLGTGGGTVEPQWTWSFSAPSTWLATGLALNPQVATHVVFVTQPSHTLLPGTAIAPAVQVAVLDDQGNTVLGFLGSVTITLGHDGSLFQNAHLSGTKIVNVVNGMATFVDLSVDQPGMGYTLRATADPLTAATSAPFGVTLP
jgi:hypothetical protein